MTRPRVIIVVIVAALLAAAAIIYLCLPKEPRYESRTISEWIEQATAAGEDSPEDIENNPKWQAACHALQQMGPDAINWLLRLGSASDSRTRMIINSVLNSLPSSSSHIRSARDKREMAYLGFTLLGKTAKPAWSAFSQWTSDRDPDRRVFGASCLLCTSADPELVKPILLRMLKDPDPNVQLAAARLFKLRFRKDAEAAGIYKMFPQLQPQKTGRPATNQPASTTDH